MQKLQLVDVKSKSKAIMGSDFFNEKDYVHFDHLHHLHLNLYHFDET